MNVKPSKAGNSIRAIADNIKAQTELEKTLMAGILARAAKIADNHDKLITEVSKTLQEDFD
jgi:hypothetical protein